MDTGFLHSYKGLEPVSSDTTHLFSKNKDINLSHYTKLYIPEVKVIALSEKINPYDRELFTQISAYSTASYKKLISKKSSNYELVDVAQKGTLILEVALSMVDGDDILKAHSLAFKSDAQTQEAYSKGEARLLVEVKTSDAMNNEVLVQSMHLISDQEVLTTADTLKFRDVQPALDRWLTQLIK